jgi:hypothetical protein
MAKASRRPKLRDVAMIVGRDSDGFQVLRRRAEDQPVEMGTIRPLQEGKPIDGEVVSLRQRKDMPFLFDVRTQLALEQRRSSDGPAQVATEEYRRGWEAIWGHKGSGSGAKPN